ncbi:MAG: MFS transporter [Burkholderiales bacterium]|nr:MFS transporter [Burkholderiales bacterium]
MTTETHRLDKYFGKLWRSRDFRTLWISLTITHFGGQVTFLALPLTAALMLNAAPLEMGILTAVEALPYTLFGLFTGVLVDRSKKLPLIIMADVGRGLALLAVPVAAWFGLLSMSVLYVVGFLVGLGGIIGWAAYQVFMTERVGRENLVEANSRIALSDSSAQLIGPGLAGIFIHWLTAPFAILLDAIAFFTSAWMLKGIKAQASDAPKTREKSATVWQDAKEGLHLIWNNPVLRSLGWGLAIWQFLKHMYFAIVILFAARDLALSPGTIGAVWMLGGVGFLIASFWVQHANKLFGVGRVMLGGLLSTGIAWLLIALVSPGSWAALHLGVAIFVLDLGAMLFFINYLTLRQSVTPDHLLGRVTSTMIFLAIACAPLGSLAGGAMAELFGLRTTIGVAGAGGLVLCILLVKFSPLAAMHELPKHSPPVPTAAASSQELAAE